MFYKHNIIFLTLILTAAAIFTNPLKKLKQKSKEAFNKKLGRDKTWHFLGFDLTEYPGTNQKYRDINQEKWTKYYDCLKSKNQATLSIIPEAIETIEGASITLDCNICLSPLENHKNNLVKWFWAPPDGTKLIEVEYDENILLSPSDKALQLFNVNRNHNGQYICQIGKAEAAPYFLTVVSTNDNNLNTVHQQEAPSGPYPAPIEKINGTKLILDTKWLPWTSCSKCNQIGRRHRLGYCIVKYNDATTSQKTNAIDISLNHYKLLDIFKNGIPCSSYLLPPLIKNLQQVAERRNEIMIGYCRISCPENEVFEVLDKDGNILERANNSAGIYSVLQGIPAPQPSVERVLQFAVKGKEVILACPGNLISDAPVNWQIGSKILIPELIVVESKGRIYISITDKLHIKDAKIVDTNVYSCWQHNDLAGTVRLIVEKKFSLDFNHHIMLFGATSIALVLLYVSLQAFFRRKISYESI